MQTVLDPPTAEADGHLRQAADEQGEFALLTQFMRHDSVASLANAIAERLGGAVHGGDLIAAAGLGSNGRDSCRLSEAIRVNPAAGFRR
ncbi:MAG TPA: hypothetical protein VGG79_05140 [Roseiarcus sp.]